MRIFKYEFLRFTETIRETTGGVTPDIDWLVHDVKMLLVRFAINAKFHLDSGGGGPESNLKLIPYLLQASLYVLNQTKQQSLYSELVENYLTDFDAASSATDVKEMVDFYRKFRTKLRCFKSQNKKSIF